MQVRSGQEERAHTLLGRSVDESLYDEAFVPYYEKKIARQGVWSLVREILLPGYLFVSTEDIDALNVALRGVPTYARILANEDGFRRMPQDDADWLTRYAGPTSWTIGFSTGRIEEGVLRVDSGPLVGREDDINKLDRRKRLAYLGFHLRDAEEPRLIRVGLEVVSKTVHGTPAPHP